MRLIYTEGFGLHERKEVRQVIFANMIVAFKIIGEEMRDLGMDYELKESSVSGVEPLVLSGANVIQAVRDHHPRCRGHRPERSVSHGMPVSHERVMARSFSTADHEAWQRVRST